MNNFQPKNFKLKIIIVRPQIVLLDLATSEQKHLIISLQEVVSASKHPIKDQPFINKINAFKKLKNNLKK